MVNSSKVSELISCVGILEATIELTEKHKIVNFYFFPIIIYYFCSWTRFNFILAPSIFYQIIEQVSKSIFFSYASPSRSFVINYDNEDNFRAGCLILMCSNMLLLIERDFMLNSSQVFPLSMTHAHDKIIIA